MKKKIINIGVLGAGKHAIKNTIPAILKLKKRYKLIAVHKRNIKKDKKKFQNFKYKLFDNLDKILKLKNLDAVYISSPPRFHFNMAKKALLLNKHVIIEKPAVTNFNQAKILKKIANKNKVIIMEAFMYKFHNQFINLLKIFKNIKDKNQIKIYATYGYPHINKDNYRYKVNLGGGSLLDVGCYTVSAFRYFSNDNLILKKAKIFKKKNQVDLKGIAEFKSANSVSYKSKWYIGGPYKNIIKVKNKDKIIIADRIFSKHRSLETKIDFYKNKKLIKSTKIKQHNHFTKMFISFYKFCNSKRSIFNQNNDFYMQAEKLDYLAKYSQK